jgi:hypothetical protein
MVMMRFKVPHDPGTRQVRHGTGRPLVQISDDDTGALDEKRQLLRARFCAASVTDALHVALHSA